MLQVVDAASSAEFSDLSAPEMAAPTFSSEDEVKRARKWAEIRTTLYSYLTLGADWDGEGATAPRTGAIIAALDFLSKTLPLRELPPSRALPTPDGGILIEWQFNDSYVTVEFLDERLVECMAQSPYEGIAHKSFVLPQAEPSSSSLGADWSQAEPLELQDTAGWQ